MRASGIQLIVVGVGADVKREELLQITGNIPQDVYIVKSFKDLQGAEFVEAIVKSVCTIGAYTAFFF